MMERSHAPKSFKPLLVLSILVALLVFVVLHDSTNQHTAESAATTLTVSEDMGEHHSPALCALLIVGAYVSLRKVRVAPSRRSVSQLDVSFLMVLGESRSSPWASQSLFEFSPILA